MKKTLHFKTPKDQFEAINELISRNGDLTEAYFLILSIKENGFLEEHHTKRIDEFLNRFTLPIHKA